MRPGGPAGDRARARARRWAAARVDRFAPSCLAAATLLSCGGGGEPRPADAGATECEDGQLQICYPADPATLDVGACVAGVSLCLRGRWGACEGAVPPSTERCDGEDNDCDRETDEGVLSACGVCGVCNGACFGRGEACDPFRDGEDQGFFVRDGALVADTAGGPSARVAWIAWKVEGSVFRLDAVTLETQASYWTGSQHGMNGDRPGQVLVNLEGSVIIANEANGLVASITKIAADRSLCADKDRDGRIETSTAWDDVLDFRSPDDWDDECILWHTELGAEGAVAPVLVEVDGAERGWVGLNPDGWFLEFDPVSGELTGERVSTGELDPNSAAADQAGWVWYAAYNWVGRFDAYHPEEGAEVVATAPDIDAHDGTDYHNPIVDEYGVPWVGGDQVWRWDPVREELVSLDLPNSGWASGFGYTMASDGRGTVWAGSRDTASELFRISNDENPSFEVVPLESGGHFAVDVDGDGRVWAVPGQPPSTPTSVLDPSTGVVDDALDDCGGAPCITTTWVAEGDFTGLQLRNVRQPMPHLTRIVSACAEGAPTAWARLSVDADAPEGNELRVDARVADTMDGLSSSRWVLIGTIPDEAGSFDLRTSLPPSGRFLELRLVVLEVAERDPAIIRTIAVEWGCPEGPG